MNRDVDDSDDFFSEQGQGESPELEDAHEAFEQGDYRQALELLEDYLEEHPLDVEALTLCALTAANLGDFAKAMSLYRFTLRLDAKNGPAHHNLGALLEGQGRYEEALVHFYRALDLQPDFPEIYINIGNVLDELGRSEEALQLYDEALLHVADEGTVYYNRGCALNRLGRYAEALECFEQVPPRNPQAAAAWNGRGYALSGLGREEEAAAAYGQAIMLNPHLASYHYNRGLSRVHLGRSGEALSDFESALRLDPTLVEAAVEMAGVLIQLQRLDEALTVLDRVEQSQADQAEAAFYRGVILERRGDLQAAREAFQQCVGRDPGATYGLLALGHVLMELERFDEALTCFDSVLARSANDPSASYNRACVFARRGQVQLALRALRQAAREDSSYLDAARSDASFDGVRDSRSFQRLLGRNA